MSGGGELHGGVRRRSSLTGTQERTGHAGESAGRAGHRTGAGPAGGGTARERSGLTQSTGAEIRPTGSMPSRRCLAGSSVTGWGRGRPILERDLW